MKWFILSTLGLLLVACSTQKVDKLEPAPIYIGSVDRIFPAQNYVLIRLIGPIPQPGMTIITQAPEGAEIRSANLVISSERLGSIRVPADIRSGSVLTGDYAFIYRKIGDTPQPTSGEELPSDDVSAPKQPSGPTSPPTLADTNTQATAPPTQNPPKTTADIPNPEWLTPQDNNKKKPTIPKIGAEELGDVPLRIEDEY